MNVRVLLLLLLPVLVTGCGPSAEQVALANQVVALQTRVAELESEGTRLGGELSAAQVQIEELSAASASARADVVSRDAALTAAAAQVDELRGQLAAALDQSAAQADELRGQLAAALDQSAAQADALRGQIAAADERAGAAQERALMLSSVVTKTRDELQARLRDLLATVDAGRVQASDLGARLADSEAVADKLESTLRRLRAQQLIEQRDSAAAIASLEGKLQDALNRNTYLVSVVDTERAAHVAQHSEMKEQLAAARASASQLGAHLAASTSLDNEMEREAAAAAAAEAKAKAAAAAKEEAAAAAAAKEEAAAAARAEAEAAADAEAENAPAAADPALLARVGSIMRQLAAARERSERLLGAVESCQRELREQGLDLSKGAASSG